MLRYCTDPKWFVSLFCSYISPFCFPFFLPHSFRFVNCFVHGHIEFGEIFSIDVYVFRFFFVLFESVYQRKKNNNQIELAKCELCGRLISLCGYIWHSLTFVNYFCMFVCILFCNSLCFWCKKNEISLSRIETKTVFLQKER